MIDSQTNRKKLDNMFNYIIFIFLANYNIIIKKINDLIFNNFNLFKYKMFRNFNDNESYIILLVEKLKAKFYL